MQKLRKIGIIAAFIIIIAFMMAGKTKAASDFDLEAVNFEVELTEQGDMKVTETWQVDLNGMTNTLFKTFKTDSSKYGNIENVTVQEMENGALRNFTQISQLQYHVSTDCYYARKNSSGDFEIAWGINQSSGDKTYIIQYTVTDAISVYNDCAELYWQFIGEDFSSPISKVTGTIKLPSTVENIDNLRIWGHGGLNGEVGRTDASSAYFTMSPYITGNYLEIRMLVLEPEMFPYASRITTSNMQDSIIQEETAWAEYANEQREAIKQKEATIFWISMLVSAILSAILITQIIKIIQKIKQTPKKMPSMELEYFRDIPNENSTPSEVGFLYYYHKTPMQSIMPKILASTMLDLSLKKFITFEMTDKKKAEVTVNLKQEADTNVLKTSEAKIYELFKKVAGEGKSFTMKDFEKYAQKHNTSFLNVLNKVETEAKKEQEAQENYDDKVEKQHGVWGMKGAAAMVATIAVGVPLAVLGIPLLAVGISAVSLIVYSIVCYKMAGRLSGLTQKGIDEKHKWEGLKKYMDDFSMIDKREVPELVLWEKYLVYATLFGNAQKVLEQLKVVYPEFTDDDYLRNTTYFYLMAHTNFNTSFMNSVNHSMQSAYQSSVASSSYSSGGGFGGGFSGGGGGRRWRWPAAVDAKSEAYYQKKTKKVKLFWFFTVL